MSKPLDHELAAGASPSRAASMEETIAREIGARIARAVRELAEAQRLAEAANSLAIGRSLDIVRGRTEVVGRRVAVITRRLDQDRRSR